MSTASTPSSEPTPTDAGALPDAPALGTPDGTIEGLVWLTLPDAAELSGAELSLVRRWLRDGDLIATRRGERRVLSIPSAFILEGAPVPTLKGTVTVLRDSGYDDDAAIRWLFTPDETIPGTPIEALRLGRKTEIRRRAQALGF